ncbi:hypothetical protein EV182_008820, partial [Spiromyces aspiralis]
MVPKADRRKFASHSVACMYLGIESDHSVHLLYNLETHRLIRSQNVMFFEDQSLETHPKVNLQIEHQIEAIEPATEKFDMSADSTNIRQQIGTTFVLAHSHDSDDSDDSDNQSADLEHDPKDDCRNITDELNFDPN